MAEAASATAQQPASQGLALAPAAARIHGRDTREFEEISCYVRAESDCKVLQGLPARSRARRGATAADTRALPSEMPKRKRIGTIASLHPSRRRNALLLRRTTWRWRTTRRRRRSRREATRPTRARAAPRLAQLPSAPRDGSIQLRAWYRPWLLEARAVRAARRLPETARRSPARAQRLSRRQVRPWTTSSN